MTPVPMQRKLPDIGHGLAAVILRRLHKNSCVQRDTIGHLSDCEVLTFVAATFKVSRSSDLKIGKQDGDTAEEVIPVRGDLQNT